MADKPKYANIIDEFLDSREPDWKDLGLKDAKDSGEEWLNRTHDEADTAFLDELAEGASHHTNVPANSKGATLKNRLIDKEAATPILGVGQAASTRLAASPQDYKSDVGDNDSLLTEVTETLEAAASTGKVEKKDRSDGEIQRYVHDLLNQGVSPAKVAAKLKKLAELELFNHQMGTRYLQDNAGLLGMAYMEPNTFMDKNNPNYERKTAYDEKEYQRPGSDEEGNSLCEHGGRLGEDCSKCGGKAKKAHFNSQSELKQLREQGGVMSQIRAGDRVTILIPSGSKRDADGRTIPDFTGGKQQSGRAVMLGPAGWVLNMGGRHGTPAIANEENIVKVNKSKSSSTWYSDLKKKDPQLAAAYAVVGVNQPMFALRNMVRALSSMNLLNTPDDEKRLEVAKYIIEHSPKTASWQDGTWVNDGKTFETCPVAQCDHEDSEVCSGGGFESPCPCKDCHPALIGEEHPHAEFIHKRFDHVSHKKAADETTPVLFRKWKKDGDVIAIFPYDVGTNDASTCSSYQHVGQHGSCDPAGLMGVTVEAAPEEYEPLKQELESSPYEYRLMLIHKLPSNAYTHRQQLLQQYNTAPAKEASSSKDCVRQATAWKAAGIIPRAKSVKQISACADCTYFSKNGATKTCNLYHLPVVGNTGELTKVINRMTAGVPAVSKKAALVQIANQVGERVQTHKASIEAPFVHQAAYTHERQKGFVEPNHFGGVQVQKLHTAGHSLKAIMAAAEKKFGALESSKAVREFIASLRKEKGKIIMAKADADYLKKIGIHNEAIVGAAKCASCKAHNGKQQHKAAATEGVSRVPDVFVASTPERVRAAQTRVVAKFDSSTVAKLHGQGHSLDKIYKAASSKVGSVQASKAVREWAHNLKNTNTKIALSQIDCTTLQKMGVKLSSQNAIIGAAKCADCTYRNGMHCGLTGGTLLSFPGMNQAASKKKATVGAPEDGRSILKEFDLMSAAPQADIDMTPLERGDVEISSKPDAGEI